MSLNRASERKSFTDVAFMVGGMKETDEALVWEDLVDDNEYAGYELDMSIVEGGFVIKGAYTDQAPWMDVLETIEYVLRRRGNKWKAGAVEEMMERISITNVKKEHLYGGCVDWRKAMPMARKKISEVVEGSEGKRTVRKRTKMKLIVEFGPGRTNEAATRVKSETEEKKEEANYRRKREESQERKDEDKERNEQLEEIKSAVGELNKLWTEIGDHDAELVDKVNIKNEKKERVRECMEIREEAQKVYEEKCAQVEEQEQKVENWEKQIQAVKNEMGKRMKEWEEEAVEVSHKAKQMRCSVAVEWDGRAWERIGALTGRGPGIRMELKEMLQKQAEGSGVKWDDGRSGMGAKSKRKKTGDEVTNLREEYKNAVDSEGNGIEWGEKKDEKAWKGNVWELTKGMAMGGKIWDREFEGVSYTIGAAKVVQFVSEEECWHLIRYETVGNAPKWRLMRSEMQLGFRGTEYGVPGGQKIERMWGLRFPIRSLDIMDWAFGYASPSEKEAKKLHEEWGEVADMMKPWMQYREEQGIVSWDQWETLRQYQPSAAWDAGRGNIAKVDWGLRQHVFDYDGSRMEWMLQHNETTGMFIDMSPGEPQYVGWRAYCQNCIGDGLYKKMDVARIWGLNLNDDKELTFGSEYLKMVVYNMISVWEETGSMPGIVAMNIRGGGGRGCQQNLKDRMIMGEIFVKMATGLDVWNLIRGIDGMLMNKGGTIRASWADNSFNVDALRQGNSGDKASSLVLVGEEVSNFLWDCRDWVNENRDRASFVVKVMEHPIVPEGIKAGTWRKAGNDEWRQGMLKTCRACGEIGHLSGNRELCEITEEEDVECVECGAKGHSIRACGRLGFENLYSTTTRKEVMDWMDWVSAGIRDSRGASGSGGGYLRVNQNGQWDGVGGPRDVYKNRKKSVKGLVVYEPSRVDGRKDEWQEAGRMCMRGNAEDLNFDGIFNARVQLKG